MMARPWCVTRWMMVLAVFSALLVTRGTRAEVAVGTSAAPKASADGTGAPEGNEPPSPWQEGPQKIALGHEVTLELPAAYSFLPKEFAKQVLEANGSIYNDNLLGLVAGADLSTDWFTVIRFDAEGYVKDDEEIDGEELLSSMREGNAEANEERKKRGFSALTLDGWSDPPHYDRAKHQLVWALIVSDAEGKSVNYNTRILGRRGFVSVNLVTDPQKLDVYKPHARALLAATRFNSGARYEDFQPSTDKVAEYGLAGLIAAGAGLGAAKLVKIGLLAKFSKVILAALIAGKKFIVLAFIALAALAKKLLSGKKNEQPAG